MMRAQGTRGATVVGVSLSPRKVGVELREENALLVLGALLPRLNWRGASPSSIRRATKLLDRAEDRTADSSGDAKRPAAPWEWLAINSWPRAGTLQHMDMISLHALEMAVSEELERRAMVGEAHVLGARWIEAETVAAIADDMFLPDDIREWIRAHRDAAADLPTTPPRGAA